ncbi:ELKS/Rab6-interacting/CAST family member 1-like isoform X1 [Saccostrea cucullata]|uniref:ELKS/Rab6-interacting/CAST family member 1-like isoform X1 n=1 Tax=Saccostrea cuccullata TaxID=36930 RepID=UPI002ED00076
MYSEKRLQEILTQLACRSADVPIDMLPIPFDTELILDFGDEAVKDLKSKKEILKFERNWVDMVEEEELRQENLSKVEGMLKVMDFQIKLKEEMQEELKKEAPSKIVKLRSTFIGIEKSRKAWKPIHQELMAFLTQKDQDKIKVQYQKKIMMKMFKELKEVASREYENRNERLERRQTTWRGVHKELMAVLTRRDQDKIKIHHQQKIMSEMLKELKVVALMDFEGRTAREEKRKAIHKELMAVLTRKDHEKIKVHHQRKIMSEMLRELKVVALMDFEGRIAREEKRQAIHKELMAVLTRRDQDKTKIHHQKKIMSEMLEELKVVALLDFEGRIAREEKRQAIHKELMIVLTKKKFEGEQFRKQQDMMLKMLKELKTVLTKRNLEEKQFQILKALKSAMLKELKKLNKDNKSDLEKEEEEELFVPRKLFLFKVDTFKTSPQNVETEILPSEIKNKNDHCATRVEMMPGLQKKKSLRGRLRKFFGFK